MTEVRTGDTKNTADTGFILAKIYLYLTLQRSQIYFHTIRCYISKIKYDIFVFIVVAAEVLYIYINVISFLKAKYD